MLVKKELMTVPVLSVPKVETSGRIDYLIAAELVELPKSGYVLVADFFKSKEGNFVFRFLSDGTNFYTCLGWPEGIWGKSNPAINYWMPVCGASRKEDTETAESFLGKKEKESWRANGVLGVIDAFISDWKNEKAQREADRREQLRKEHFAMFPPLPDDLKAYCDDNVFSHGYIFFESLTKDRRRFGQCGSCGKRFEILGEARHNTETVCPECGRKSLYKAAWRQKVIEERAKICITAKVNGQLLIRWTDVTRCAYKTGSSYTFVDYAYNLYLNDGKKQTMVSYEYRMPPYAYERYWKRWRNGDQNFSRAYVYTRNLRDVFGEKYYNVDMQKGLEGKRIQLRFSSLLNNLKNLPVAEYLFKLGMPQLAEEAERFSIKAERIMKSGGKAGFGEVLGISKQYLPMYREMDISWWEHRIIRDYGAWVSREDMEAFRKLNLGITASEDMVKELLKTMSFGKLTRYFGKQMQATKRTAEHLMMQYRDYISMAEEMKIDLSRKDLRYPVNVLEAHDDTVKIFNKMKMEAENAEFINAVKEIYERLPVHEYEGEKYCIVFPQLRTDLMVEGQSLGHCVGSKRYSENHMKGTSMIFFVRKRENVEKSFFTLQVDMDRYRIVQLHGKGNCGAPEDVRRFAEQFVKALNPAEKDKRRKTA